MVGAPSRFRRDLTVTLQQSAGRIAWVIKDPVTGRLFRFREEEAFIAQQLDGSTSLDAIRQRTEMRFGAALPETQLRAFVADLDRAGLLEQTDGTAPSRRARRGWIRGGPLSLRLAVGDPDRFLNRVSPWVRGCFTRRFVVLSGSAIALGVATAIANWGAILQDVAHLFQLSTIPPLLVTTFLLVSAHEMAHALTCKRFGGEVREAGLMLVYFLPALYCNVSDAWLFPEKRQRLWVGFAGPYFELFLWALAVLCWRVTAVETWINYVALLVMASSGVRTLLNFVPLIKLDGYYLLSDYLDVPNLRRKSFRYVGNGLKRLTGFAAEPTDRVGARERRIYLSYGILALAFSLALLVVVAVKLGGFLIDHRQPLALAGLAGVLGVRLRNRLGKVFGATRAGTTIDDGPPERAARSIEPARGLADGRRRTMLQRRAGVLLVATALVAAGFLVPWELRISGPLTVLPVHNADVRVEIGGLVEAISVGEGEHVRRGDLLARLSDRDLRAEREQTEAEIRVARERLRMLVAGPTPEEIAVSRAAVEEAQNRVRYARARLERSRQLAVQGGLSQVELEQVEEQAVAAENHLAAATRKLELLVRGARPEEIGATEAEISRLDARLRFLEGQLQRVEVRSPVTGTVATPARQLESLVGQMVQPGALIAKVYDVRKLTAEIEIPENEIADVTVGQEVAFKARAYPNRTFRGMVTSIAATAQTDWPSSASGASSAPARGRGGGKTVLVTTEIDNDSSLLKPGMTGEAKVYAGERSIVDLVARRLTRMLKVEFWSWW